VNWTASAAGTFVFSARAVDAAGLTATSTSASVTVTAATPHATAVFTPPTDQSSVQRYIVDLFPNGSDPATSTPAATQDIGKPATVAGEISADISTALRSIPAGTYIATVTAATNNGNARSAPSAPFLVSSGTVTTTDATSVLASTVSSSGAELSGSSPSNSPWSHGVVWATDASTGLVTAFDATTADVVATIPVGLGPTGIASPRGVDKVYVADSGSDTISVISKTAMTVVRTIALPTPAGRQPHDVSASDDGGFVYVAERGSNVVNVIDTATDQLTARFGAARPGASVRAVISDSTGGVLYALSGATGASPGTIVALDRATGQWLWQMPVDGGDPAAFALVPGSRVALLMRAGDHRATVIDLERHAVVSDVELPSNADASTMQVSPDGRYLVVGVRASQQVAVTRVPDLAGAITTSRARNELSDSTVERVSYVVVPGGNGGEGGIVAVDASRQSIVTRFRLPGGNAPDGVAYDSAR
jgi:YVTN family beta-propeller protein